MHKKEKGEERRKKATAGATTKRKHFVFVFCVHMTQYVTRLPQEERRERRSPRGVPGGAFFPPGGFLSVSKIPNSVKGQAVVFLQK